MFIDEAEITIQGGNGGNGKVAFYAGRKGPSGGNGGKGGNLYFIASSNSKDSGKSPSSKLKMVKREDPIED